MPNVRNILPRRKRETGAGQAMRPFTHGMEDFFRSEMAYGRLFRVIHLPVEVMGDDAKAEMKDGIIEVYLPKVEGVTPHTIKVA